MERTPYAHKVRYGITGAPILTDDQMDGSHAPGVGISPTLIELAYIPARDGKPARIDASVTGWWTRFGKLDEFGGQMTTHFKNGPDGWPAWLAEEAQLHDPERTDAEAPTDWIDGHPQLEAIAAAVWEKCRRTDSGGCVDDDPRNIAVAAYAAVLATQTTCPDAIECSRQAALGEAQQEVRRLGLMVDEYAAGARSLGEKLREAREDCDRSDEGARRALEQRQEMAEERYVLQEQRDRLRTELASARTSLSLEVDWIIEHCPEHGCVEPETDLCHCVIAERLRRLATAAVLPQPETQAEAPADPWSMSYHRLGPAENNPAVCICGLGPEAVLHNEPPHRFNGRPKLGMPPVHGICTDCHHHETAACHTPADEE